MTPTSIGSGCSRIVHETERLGFNVLVARQHGRRRTRDSKPTPPSAAWWSTGGKRGMLSKPAGLISLVRRRGLEMVQTRLRW